MKFVFLAVVLAAAAQYDYDDYERHKKDGGPPNVCNNKDNWLKKFDDGIIWKCKAKNKKGKTVKKCKGKCHKGTESTAPKKVMCDPKHHWTTKKMGSVNKAAVDGGCCKKKFEADCVFHDSSNSNGTAGHGTIEGHIHIIHYSMCGDHRDRLVFKGELEKAHGRDVHFRQGKHGLHVTWTRNGTHDTGCDATGDILNFPVDGVATVHGKETDMPPTRHQGSLGNVYVNKKGQAEVWKSVWAKHLSLDPTAGEPDDTNPGGFVGNFGYLVFHDREDQEIPDDPSNGIQFGDVGGRTACCKINVV